MAERSTGSLHQAIKEVAMQQSTNRDLLEKSRKTLERSRDLHAALQLETRESEKIITRSKELVKYSKSLACLPSTVNFSPRSTGSPLRIQNHFSPRQPQQTFISGRAAIMYFSAAAFLWRLRN